MHNGNANTTSQLFQKFWIKNDIRKSKSKYQGDIADIMTIQKAVIIEETVYVYYLHLWLRKLL